MPRPIYVVECSDGLEYDCFEWSEGVYSTYKKALAAVHASYKKRVDDWLPREYEFKIYKREMNSNLVGSLVYSAYISRKEWRKNELVVELELGFGANKNA